MKPNIVSVKIDIQAHIISGLWALPMVLIICFAAYVTRDRFMILVAGLSVGVFSGLIHNLLAALATRNLKG
jgi:preprotein translocase subunit SecD